MRHIDLQAQLVQEYGISRREADRLIQEAEARRLVKVAVGRAIRGEATAQEPHDLQDPHTWGIEQQKRRAALKILDEGARSLASMRKLLDKIIQAELKFIAQKKTTVGDRSDEWWNFCTSGWARGGRELFAQFIRDILHSIDETKLGDSIRNRLGFVRTVPLPEITSPSVEEPGIPGIEPEEPLDEADVKKKQQRRNFFMGK